MPSPGATSLIALGAVLTSISGVAGSAIAALGVVWEAFLFYRLGSE